MPPADRRRAILDAVIPLILENGEAPSTKQIAAAAGIAEGTIFRVFDDKTALMRAVAVEAFNPPDGRSSFEAALEGEHDLRERVRIAADALTVRMNQAMQIMMAVRGHLMSQPERDRAPGPPEFLIDANRVLLDMLTRLFEPHRDELRLPPDAAAVVLRSLVLGSHHPGLDHAPRLTPEQIADVLVDGILIARKAPA